MIAHSKRWQGVFAALVVLASSVCARADQSAPPRPMHSPPTSLALIQATAGTSARQAPSAGQDT